jgi:predicted ATPase
MIRLIEALHFRCLRYVRQPLEPFHVLVGPNASGKTTFLDAVGFLGKMVSDGLEAAIFDRSQSFRDLVWNREESSFELAVEVEIPEERQELLKKSFDIVRYEIKIGPAAESSEIHILEERVILKNWAKAENELCISFPRDNGSPETILSPKKQQGASRIITRSSDGSTYFYSELKETSDFEWPFFRFNPRRSALGNLPEDESKFPVSTWLKTLLAQGVQNFILNSLLIRKASPPYQLSGFKPDGSNLPWVIDKLSKNEERFRSWISHLKTALPDLEAIRTVERPDDKSRYLMIRYQGGLEVPSWMASDGTLRLLALTIPAYLPDFRGVYLIEEPENGIHPSAVEALFKSLSSVYKAQILLATHSPVILSLADPKQVLCFKKTERGATDIVQGNLHPMLKDWKRDTDLGTLFVGGVLG